MDTEFIQQLEPQYRDLQNYIDLLSEDKCKITDVKHRSALLGIYREKDGTYMCRVRRNSGRILLKNLQDIADIMEAQQIHHAHLTTRQNIQLHGVPAAKVYETIKACNAADMIFRGGGGNTFRSIATSPYSGVSPSEAFDTIPHAEAVWNFVRTYERAYGFGRKFKMGLASEPTDDINAGIQDLGFVAKLQEDQRGFKVYCGGGMGRNPGLGITIFDFLAEKDLIRAVQAAIDLFFENGNRKVRPKARLRFVLQELGPDSFKQLFFQYLEETTAPDYKHQAIDYPSHVARLKKGTSAPSSGFEEWKQRSVKDTALDEQVKSVHLPIRDGNFSAQQLRAFTSILADSGIQELRATSAQNLVLPLIHATALPELHHALKKQLPGVLTTDGDFSGQMISCIGATACSIGLLKTETARAHVADAMNQLIATFPDIDPGVYESIIEDIHISGCASSCGLNQVSGLGFHGVKKRVDGDVIEFYQLHLGGQINEELHALGCTEAHWLIKADDIASVTTAFVQSYLEHVEAHGLLPLGEFMNRKRFAFSNLTEFNIQRIIQQMGN